MKRAMSNQFPLNLEHAPSFASEDFLELPCNEEAVKLLQGWPLWSMHAMALIGPGGSGKSHLGHAWCLKSNAIELTPKTDITGLGEGVNIFIDDADNGSFEEDMLFHVYNWTKETNGSLLITGKSSPTRWNIGLKDLKSRMATLQVATIGAPDDEALMMILSKLFADRQLVVDQALLQYLVLRMERSFECATRIVAEMDRLALAKMRKITKALAKEVLEILDVE